MQEYFSQSGICYRTNIFRSGRPTLVFVHGLSGSTSAWLTYEARLEWKYNILTYDLHGHGKSLKSKNYADYAVKNFTGELHELLTKLRITNFVLVSHSYGMVIALEFLRQYGDMVSRAIFLSPIVDIKKIRGITILKGLVSAGIALLNFFPFHAKTGRHIDYSKYEGTGDWKLRRMSADIPNTSLRVYLYSLKQMYEYSHYDFWHHLTLPILIVHGKEDTISPVEHSIELAKEMKNIKLVLLDHTDHMVVLNRCKEVCNAIKNFLWSVSV